jgi:hypothetical protein
MKLTHLLIGTALALVPLASAASTLEARIDSDASLVWADEDDDGLLTVAAGAQSGYEAVTINAVKQLAPPADQLLANVIVANTAGDANESIRVEVTGHFQNNAAGIWPGQFTATANDVMGSTWDIRTYVGNGAYDTDSGAQLAISASGSLLAVSNLLRFNANDYWITHVFDHTATSNNISASASADAMISPDLTPVPVPAAGLLLLGALGGLAALRRRKG